KYDDRQLSSHRALRWIVAACANLSYLCESLLQDRLAVGLIYIIAGTFPAIKAKIVFSGPLV
ncbi:MAG: hypothetical protein WA889_18810, partial [Xanthobacteraceae bacterium]